LERLKKSCLNLWNQIPAEIRPRVTVVVCTALLILQVNIMEYPLIPAGDRFLYLILKAPIPLLVIPFVIWLYRDPKNSLINVVMIITFIAYSTIGSLFRPFYVVSLLEGLTILLLTFTLTVRQFWYGVVTGLLGFSALFIFRYPNVPEVSLQLTFGDHLAILCQILIILWVIYYLFVRIKNYQLEAERRFGLIGRQAAHIAHDLKGSLAAPVLHLDSIVHTMKGQFSGTDVPETLGMVSQQLLRMEKSLAELTRLCSLDNLPMSTFKLTDCLRDSQNLFVKKMGSVDFQRSGDIEFHCDRSLLTSIFSNLMLNSAEAFRRSGVDRPEVVLTVYGGATVELLYRDNGGGFNPRILADLKRNQPTSTWGTGVGLRMVRENLERLGGRVEFRNRADVPGVEISMVFGAEYAVAKLN